jgi:hypothetical protein
MLARSSNALGRKRRSTKFTQDEWARYILAGKSCKVDRIRFQDGATGKVILNDVVNLPKISGGQIDLNFL